MRQVVGVRLPQPRRLHHEQVRSRTLRQEDLKTKPALLADIVAVAERHGYRFSADDAEALSDAQLDVVSGGGGKVLDGTTLSAKVLAETDCQKLSGGGKNPVMEPLTRSVLELQTMSQVEIQRFAADLRSDEALRQAISLGRQQDRELVSEQLALGQALEGAALAISSS